jgi:hypothetical protein
VCVCVCVMLLRVMLFNACCFCAAVLKWFSCSGHHWQQHEAALSLHQGFSWRQEADAGVPGVFDQAFVWSRRVPKFWAHWKKYNVFCDLSVREKAWRGKPGLWAHHNTLSHRVKT